MAVALTSINVTRLRTQTVLKESEVGWRGPLVRGALFGSPIELPSCRTLATGVPLRMQETLNAASTLGPVPAWSPNDL